jgi:serpin B
VLHFPFGQQRLHPTFAALESSIKAAGDGSGCSLNVANSLWGQEGQGFLAEFLAVTKKHYGARLREVDFAGAVGQARQTINAWVAGQTQQRIKELLQRGDLDRSTVLVLANAIYFKGPWASRFDAQHTREAPFQVSYLKQVVVPMMQQVRRFPLFTSDELDVLELPYIGDRLSMVLLLPKKVDGLAALEESLSTKNVDEWLGRLAEQPVRVSLPRFRLDTRFDLARTLASMGMPDAFSGGKADFSGMTGRRDLWVDAVLHEAEVEVNEEGTEASAATAVVMRKGSRVPSFIADHPFLFLIRDRQTGSILFIGRVVDPSDQ